VKKTYILAAVVSMGMVSASHAKQVLVVTQDIPFASDAKVRGKVKDECQLGTKLSKFISVYAKKYKFDVKNESSSKDDMILNVEINDVFANGGGVFSGAKVMHVSGSLSQDGKTLGDFKGMRYSTGGVFGAMKGTCSILARDAKSLGSDIAKWLKAPTKDAKLGSLD
jgi:hypothetical protein